MARSTKSTKARGSVSRIRSQSSAPAKRKRKPTTLRQKKSAKAITKNANVLCFDLGGTKLRAALVDREGRILSHAVSTVRQQEGYEGLVRLFAETARKLPELAAVDRAGAGDGAGVGSRDGDDELVGLGGFGRRGGAFAGVSIASAGPLHPEKGVLLDPTNFFTGNQSWGVLPLVRSLEKVFERPVRLENDAAAAALGERWKGGHEGLGAQNMVAMTLGTGVGVGIICNGTLVRAGRGLHPEAGHIPLDVNAKDYPCGCGAYGCVEAFLAGSHFTRRLGLLKGRPGLTGHDAVVLAEAGDSQVREAFREYGRQLAQTVRVLSVLFAPEVVVISGGFSHAAGLFLDETRKTLPRLLERYRDGIDLLPEVKVSLLQDDAGILGAAYLAFGEGEGGGRSRTSQSRYPSKGSE